MPSFQESRPPPGAKPFDFWKRVKEIDLFFQGKDSVHRMMRRTAKQLETLSILYAIVGGMAVNAHRYRRTTGDVDILLTPEGFAEFRHRLVPKKYGPVPQRPRRFVERTGNVPLDILVTGLFPRTGLPGPIAFPDPADVSEIISNVRVVDLLTLVQLKLAARRFRDLADVVGLTRFNNLDESFADKLHPSLRGDYLGCLAEIRREDEFEARED